MMLLLLFYVSSVLLCYASSIIYSGLQYQNGRDIPDSEIEGYVIVSFIPFLNIVVAVFALIMTLVEYMSFVSSCSFNIVQFSRSVLERFFPRKQEESAKKKVK